MQPIRILTIIAAALNWASTAEAASTSSSVDTGHNVRRPAPPRPRPPRNGAAFVGQTPPPSPMMPGQTARVEIRMRNSGTTTWTAAAGYKLGAQSPTDNQHWRKGRVLLSSRTAPGQTAVFAFEITAPQQPGMYNFKWRMVRERVEWFGHPTENVEIMVAVSASTGPVVGPIGPPPANGLPPYEKALIESVLARPGMNDAIKRACRNGTDWTFPDAVVDELRRKDGRWGYLCRRGNCSDPSHDVVAYYMGPGAPTEGASRVRAVDFITASCYNPGDQVEPSISWQVLEPPREGERGWTGRGRF
ncbi:MAG: hypothetical protein HY553_14265 [Elusimicrobia bacterium]|nr:hypothetical protein [Elusimicrobiota bacterium]